MCYHTKMTKDAQTLRNRFRREIKQPDLFQPSEHFNGFAKPITPVITIEEPSVISMVQWGFPVVWQPAPLLNAKIETLETTKSFKDYIDNRCLIIIDGFFEWRHEGSKKIKHEVGIGGELFCLAGIFRYEKEIPYYTIITTEAQGIMREIHNKKLRMPFALFSEEKQNSWLYNEPVEPDWEFMAAAV